MVVNTAGCMMHLTVAVGMATRPCMTMRRERRPVVAVIVH